MYDKLLSEYRTNAGTAFILHISLSVPLYFIVYIHELLSSVLKEHN